MNDMGVSKVDYGDETLIDLTADTVSEYTLCNGVTAHGANGEQINGKYKLKSELIKTTDSVNYSSTQLSMVCSFEPSAISVHYIGSGNVAYQVLDLVAWNSNSGITPYYCGHSLGRRSSSNYTILSTQVLLANEPDKFTWDGSKVYIKSPDNTYGFKNGTYRLIAYK